MTRRVGAKEVEWSVHGSKIAGLMWGNPTAKRRFFAIHGWMDNAASFQLLAPLICDNIEQSCFVAIDLMGHGKSDHHSWLTDYSFDNYLYCVLGVLQQLGWWSVDDDDQSGEAEREGENAEALDAPNPPTTSSEPEHQLFIVGHSMGSAISLLCCAAIANAQTALIMLEGPGSFTMVGQAQEAPRLATVVRNRQKALKRTPRIYSSLEDALHTRMNGNVLALSKEGARALVARGTRRVGNSSPASLHAASISTFPSTSSNSDSSSSSSAPGANDEAVMFTHDPRLRAHIWCSMNYRNEDSLQALMYAVDTPVLVVLGLDSFGKGLFDRRRDVCSRHPRSQWVKIPGGHFVHADMPKKVLHVMMEFIHSLGAPLKESASTTMPQKRSKM